MLNRDAPLFNEGRTIVEQELREPRVYFAILEQLATGGMPANEIGHRISLETNAIRKCLVGLEELRLVSKHVPFGAEPNARSGRWRLDDEFLRFWFGLCSHSRVTSSPGWCRPHLFDAEIAEVIADHVSAPFETWCMQWLRANSAGGATKFGHWWGNAAKVTLLRPGSNVGALAPSWATEKNPRSKNIYLAVFR